MLRAHDRLECSEEFRRLNFQPTVETRANPSGGAPIPSRVIQMTKDGFVMLVMGFTGKEAMKTKEAYIKAFNAMAEHFKKAHKSVLRACDKLSTASYCDGAHVKFDQEA